MIFVILGMHKSGTTVLSEILHRSGIGMGQAVDGKGYDSGNKAERAGPKAINKRLLGEEEVARLSWEWEPVPKREELWREQRGAALEMLAREGAVEGGDWGFKDPRTVMTWEFWREVLPEDRRLVLIYRHPAEVCEHYLPYHPLKRLTHRPACYIKALRAWHAYNTRLLELAGEKGERGLLLEYGRLMEGPEELARLERFCGRPLHDVRQPELYRRKNRGGFWFAAARAWQRRQGRDAGRLWEELENARAGQVRG